MKSMRLSLDHDAGALSPIHEAIRASPDIDGEVVFGGQAVDGVETITSFVRGEPSAYEAVLEDLDGVREYDMAPADDGFFLYLRRDLGPEGKSMLDALGQETVVVVPPIEIRSDGRTRLTVVGHPDEMTAVLEELSEGVSADVLWVSDSVTVTEPSVSERQLEALEAAWNVGFYEVPRRNGIEAVADELGCAISTASELVRRGEANAVGRVLDSRP